MEDAFCIERLGDMKKCKHCGALQQNHHSNCIDCGELLGSPLTEQEEKVIEGEVKEKISDLSNKTDYFHVSKLDKVIAILLIISAVSSILIRIFVTGHISDDLLIVITITIPLQAIEAFDLLCPWFSWELYKFKMVFTVANTDDLVPNELMLYTRRILSYGTALVMYAVLIYIMIILII